jgi:hypothetical protein
VAATRYKLPALTIVETTKSPLYIPALPLPALPLPDTHTHTHLQLEMVSAFITSIQGAFTPRSQDELTQADINAILQQTEGDLQELWFEIEVLEQDALQTDDVLSEPKKWRTDFRR